VFTELSCKHIIHSLQLFEGALSAYTQRNTHSSVKLNDYIAVHIIQCRPKQLIIPARYLYKRSSQCQSEPFLSTREHQRLSFLATVRPLPKQMLIQVALLIVGETGVQWNGWTHLHRLRKHYILVLICADFILSYSIYLYAYNCYDLHELLVIIFLNYLKARLDVLKVFHSTMGNSFHCTPYSIQL